MAGRRATAGTEYAKPTIEATHKMKNDLRKKGNEVFPLQRKYNDIIQFLLLLYCVHDPDEELNYFINSTDTDW